MPRCCARYEGFDSHRCEKERGHHGNHAYEMGPIGSFGQCRLFEWPKKKVS